MSRIRLFEQKGVAEVDRLAGLRLETISPLLRHGRWRRQTPHADAHPVIIWIARGQGRIAADGKMRGYGAATLVSLPAGTPFWIEPGTVTEGTLLRLPDLFEAPVPPHPRHLRLSDLGAQAELAGLLDQLARAGDLTDPPEGRAALGRVILVSAAVERADRDRPRPRPGGPERLAARFVREVERLLGTGANLEEIGAALAVTPTHLTRTLRATCGMTAAAYLAARTMHEARRRLADTDATAASIAADLGFATAPHFTRAFGRVVGQTPSAFRKAARGPAQ